jgi:soluble lytic murein transglycosylase-like protein
VPFDDRPFTTAELEPVSEKPVFNLTKAWLEDILMLRFLYLAFAFFCAPAFALAQHAAPAELRAMVDHHARNHGVPFALAHQLVMKESRYNPAARNRSFWGLMQLRFETARSVGYRGPASGLLDPDVNLRYGMAYLGNAYRVAGRDARRAMALYSKGFYYEAKRKGMLGQMRNGVSATPVSTP